MLVQNFKSTKKNELHKITLTFCDNTIFLLSQSVHLALLVINLRTFMASKVFWKT
jgi:hypothetical protein